MTIGQYFPSLEKIGKITHAGGILTLGATHTRVGGLGVTIDSSLDKTISGLSNNTLYYIYLVISSNNPQLEVSTNDDSVGPAGFSAWKLVGRFWTDGSGNFNFLATLNDVGVVTHRVSRTGTGDIVGGSTFIDGVLADFGSIEAGVYLITGWADFRPNDNVVANLQLYYTVNTLTNRIVTFFTSASSLNTLAAGKISVTKTIVHPGGSFQIFASVREGAIINTASTDREWQITKLSDEQVIDL